MLQNNENYMLCEKERKSELCWKNLNKQLSLYVNTYNEYFCNMNDIKKLV